MNRSVARPGGQERGWCSEPCLTNKAPEERQAEAPSDSSSLWLDNEATTTENHAHAFALNHRN